MACFPRILCAAPSLAVPCGHVKATGVARLGQELSTKCSQGSSCWWHTPIVAGAAWHVVFPSLAPTSRLGFRCSFMFGRGVMKPGLSPWPVSSNVRQSETEGPTIGEARLLSLGQKVDSQSPRILGEAEPRSTLSHRAGVAWKPLDRQGLKSRVCCVPGLPLAISGRGRCLRGGLAGMYIHTDVHNLTYHGDDECLIAGTSALTFTYKYLYHLTCGFQSSSAFTSSFWWWW